MKFYYDKTGYKCTWSNKIKGNTWWNMEPVKLKVRIPMSLYRQIVFDLKTQNDGAEVVELKFKVHKEKNEIVNWNIYSTDDSELWSINAIIDRISYTSKFNDGTVTANIDFMVQNHGKCEKSELRDLLLNELV